MEDGRETSEDSGNSEVTEIAEVTGISEPEPVITGDEELDSSPPKKIPRKESIYDKIPLSKKQLDVIIVILMVALVVFFILGALIGNGLI